MKKYSRLSSAAVVIGALRVIQNIIRGTHLNHQSLEIK